MTRDEIIRMASEADREWDCDRDTVVWLEWFAALVAAAEREECAKVCETIGEPNPLDPNSKLGEYYRNDIAAECADAIRARNKG